MNEKQSKHLKLLPGVDHILKKARDNSLFNDIPKSVVIKAVRSVIAKLRESILDNNKNFSDSNLTDALILSDVEKLVQEDMRPNFKRVINATGVVVHTNLGRSLLAKEALKNIVDIAGGYSNLEFDLLNGKRGSRYSLVENILCEISGAESAMVVNNNAGAVFLSLNTVAKQKEVIVSRGELVEIGGSFRIPDVMEKSGAILKEVGTTNRTHLKDYENAISENTGLLLKVHTSNYSVIGFTAAVSLKEMVALGNKSRLPVMEDLGSGTFIDFSKYNMTKEPTIQESVASGADIITFSGDKLLGGPQAGIIIGSKIFINQIKQNPLARALRIDKLTLAALESTLRFYREPEKAVKAIPTLRMLTIPLSDIKDKAEKLVKMLSDIDEPDFNKSGLNQSELSVSISNISSRAGGGALPLLDLPSKAVRISIAGISANSIEKSMRLNNPPIIGRIEDDLFVLDLRTIHNEELAFIVSAIKQIMKTKDN
ncbi:MAG: L-seryl-tRNA(Sec) selenium transferase [Deltaproteobacteria bacterium]|nr:L-seryl-tRNA(Sec) selenium transferase [Deltaproteobacteria bacterium]